MSTKPVSPFQKTVVLACSTAFGIAAGYGFMKANEASTARGVASVEQAPAWQPNEFSKHLAPVKVQIKAPEMIPAQDQTSVEITGYVTLNQAVQADVQYRWILPEGVSIVDGQASGVWTTVHGGQTSTTKISVIGFSKEEKKVLTLEASANIGNHQMGNTALISSRPEDSMEFIAPAKMKARHAFDKANRTEE